MSALENKPCSTCTGRPLNRTRATFHILTVPGRVLWHTTYLSQRKQFKSYIKKLLLSSNRCDHLCIIKFIAFKSKTKNKPLITCYANITNSLQLINHWNKCYIYVRWTLYLGCLCMGMISFVPSLCTLCTLYISVWSFILDKRFHVRNTLSPAQNPTQHSRSAHTPGMWRRNKWA